MTLKCKIKEMSEMEAPPHQESQITKDEEEQSKKEDEEEEPVMDEEFQLHEIGTIEEMSLQAAKERKRRRENNSYIRSKTRGRDERSSYRGGQNFYDRNSICRKPSSAMKS